MHVIHLVMHHLNTVFLAFDYQSERYVISGRAMVINVEYNQLDPLLKATGHPDGDVNCETGYSPYPGNINQVIILCNSIFSFFPLGKTTFLNYLLLATMTVIFIYIVSLTKNNGFVVMIIVILR